MKSAEAFVQVLQRGLRPAVAANSLPTFDLQYVARIPIVIYRAAQQLHWRFFVLSSNGDSTPDGSEIDSATNDLEQLKCWARQRPRWALATGSGVLVLEVDSAEGGQDSLLELCRDDWGWLDTLRSSAGFKRYIFFRCLDPRRQLNGFGQIGKGLRVLVEGDWVPMPGSYGSNVAEPAYLNPRLEIGPAPLWLLKHPLVKADEIALSTGQSTDDKDAGSTHRICMSLVFTDGWHCRFHAADICKTPISKMFSFHGKEKIYEMVRRGHGIATPEAFEALDQAVAVGRGQVWLELSDAQYQALRLSKSGVAV